MIYILKIRTWHQRCCLLEFARFAASVLVLAVALPSAALDIVSDLGGGSATSTFDPDAS